MPAEAMGRGGGPAGPAGADRMAVAFATALRRLGMEVSPSSVVTFVEALGCVGLEDRAGVYWAGRSTLVHRPEHHGLYDHAFAAVWLQSEAIRTGREVEPVVLDLDDDQVEAGPTSEAAAPVPAVAVRYSPIEVLRHKDFSSYTERDFAEARRLMVHLRLNGPLRRSHRLRPTRRRTRHPDLRRTIHRSLRSNGEAIERTFLQRSKRPRPIVLLCDVSGSMETYTRALLRFLHAVVAAPGRVEAFALGTRLTRITRELSSHDPDAALAATAAAAPDWGGGTRLGQVLGRFNDEWGVRGMARGAVVVILSDGWDRGDPAEMSHQMARLQRVAHRVVWVNPLKGSPGYAPLARGMAAALPFVDEFVDVSPWRRSSHWPLWSPAGEGPVKEVLGDIEAWRRDGRVVAVARVVGVEGSGPRDPGATMAVNDRGEVAGSVSGGCVEGAVVAEALDVLAAGGPHRRVTYGYSDDEAFAVGLTCGGTVHLLIGPVDPEPVIHALQRHFSAGEPVALVTVVEGEALGTSIVVGMEGEAEGSLGDVELDRVVVRDARAELVAGLSSTRHYGPQGQARQSDVGVFIESFAPPPRLLIFGAVDFTAALARVAKVLGYRVTVVDARPVFTTSARFPMADEVVVEWPDRYLLSVGPRLGPRDAVCVLTHDHKFDVPAIRAALGTNVGYLGAMGSRRTDAERRRRLGEAGVAEADLERLMAPIGLDIGARTPEETAVSICAEIIAVRTGRRAPSLRDTDGPIHDRGPG